jgi:hypothetical protein
MIDGTQTMNRQQRTARICCVAHEPVTSTNELSSCPIKADELVVGALKTNEEGHGESARHVQKPSVSPNNGKDSLHCSCEHKLRTNGEEHTAGALQV